MRRIADEFWSGFVGPLVHNTRNEYVVTSLLLMGPEQHGGDNFWKYGWRNGRGV